MKAKEVLKLLKISRSTLSKYVKKGKIKVKILPSGRYEYDEDSVYAFLGKGGYRKNVIYVRVLFEDEKDKLTEQIELITKYCLANGKTVDKVYKDIGSSLDLNRPQFKKLIQDVLDYKIKKIFLLYKEKFCLLYFDLFREIFKHFGTEIVPISDKKNFPEAEKEILQESIYFFDRILKEISQKEIKERIDLIKKALNLQIHV